MGLIVDFYLRDQVIRGEWAAAEGRPLDLLNNRLDKDILLEHGLAKSLHVGAEPIRLGATRLYKDQLLLAVPHDENRPSLSPLMRAGWVEKRHARVTIGIGPLIVTGDMHLGQWEQASVEKLGRDIDGRPYIPVTAARVTSLYHPAWAVEARTVFVARAGMGYLSLLEAPADESRPATRAIEEFYRAPRPART